MSTTRPYSRTVMAAAPIANATATAAPPRLPVAPLTRIVSPAWRPPASSPPYGMRHRPSALHRAASAGSIEPSGTAFSVGTSRRSANEPWPKCRWRRRPPSPRALSPCGVMSGDHRTPDEQHAPGVVVRRRREAACDRIQAGFGVVEQVRELFPRGVMPLSGSRSCGSRIATCSHCRMTGSSSSASSPRTDVSPFVTRRGSPCPAVSRLSDRLLKRVNEPAAMAGPGQPGRFVRLAGHPHSSTAR